MGYPSERLADVIGASRKLRRSFIFLPTTVMPHPRRVSSSTVLMSEKNTRSGLRCLAISFGVSLMPNTWIAFDRSVRSRDSRKVVRKS